jgi:DNA-binding NarL/FixJ family response regulator
MATARRYGIGRLTERPLPGSTIAPSANRSEVPAAPVNDLPDDLSAREAEVLRLVATGRSNREIGEALFISQNTVANHVRAILRKTGCANRTEASLYAVRHGVLDG